MWALEGFGGFIFDIEGGKLKSAGNRKGIEVVVVAVVVAVGEAQSKLFEKVIGAKLESFEAG